MVRAATAIAAAFAVGSACTIACELGDDRARLVVEREAEQLLDLAGEDDDGDARGEADGHGKRDVFDEGAEPAAGRSRR